MSKDILDEILDKIHDLNETETETDKELKKREQISFEEIRVDEQLMDTKTKQVNLSDQNDEKIRIKQKRQDDEDLLQQAEKERNFDLLRMAQLNPKNKRKRELSHKSEKN